MDKIDWMVEEALKMNVRASLQSIAREVNGDGKTLPDPLFKVKVMLNDVKVGPSLQPGVVAFSAAHCSGRNIFGFLCIGGVGMVHILSHLCQLLLRLTSPLTLTRWLVAWEVCVML